MRGRRPEDGPRQIPSQTHSVPDPLSCSITPKYPNTEDPYCIYPIPLQKHQQTGPHRSGNESWRAESAGLEFSHVCSESCAVEHPNLQSSLTACTYQVFLLLLPSEYLFLIVYQEYHFIVCTADCTWFYASDRFPTCHAYCCLVEPYFTARYASQ